MSKITVTLMIITKRMALKAIATMKKMITRIMMRKIIIIIFLVKVHHHRQHLLSFSQKGGERLRIMGPYTEQVGEPYRGDSTKEEETHAARKIAERCLKKRKERHS